MEKNEILEKGREIINRSDNFKGYELVDYVGKKVPAEYNNVMHYMKDKVIMGALYINGDNKIIQVIDIGVFQVIVPS